MITVAAIIPVALVAGSLIGVLLNARLASRRRQAELRGPQLDEFVQSAFQALRELRIRSELTAKLNDDVDRAYAASTLDYSRDQPQQKPDRGRDYQPPIGKSDSSDC